MIADSIKTAGRSKDHVFRHHRPQSDATPRVLAAQDLGGSVFLETADIAWLKPTAPNLARLTVPIPAGFREVPVARILSAARRRT